MINRRSLLKSTVAIMCMTAGPMAAQTVANTSLRDMARALGRHAYQPNTTPLPPPFADLDYDAFRAIRPIAGTSAMIPNGSSFAFDLLPPGLYFPDPVLVDRVTPSGLSEMELSPELFSFDANYFDDIPDESPGAGFSGIRLRYKLNTPDGLDEVLVIQGASYFRAVGQSMVYGLSARSIALGTGGPTPEEFPRFTRLRLHPAQDDTVRIEGVIDSPSLTAHVDMVLRPGVDTVLDITTTIFPRVDIDTIGIAALTSMYLKGPLQSAVADDFRPHVHDSEVLFIENGAGERLWRPVANPSRVETSVFVDNGPKSFGLYQTSRDYKNFEDTEARYHDRPSASVEPQEDWGAGSVMLVEIPTSDEFLDNIVTFWRPQDALEAGSEHQFSYRLTWTLAAPNTDGLAQILQSRSGREHDRAGYRRFVIDVATPDIDAVPALSGPKDADITGVSVFALPDGAGMRVTFLMGPGALDAADIRLSLRAHDGTPLSPVWLYRWTRARDGGV